jgi:hypothetical protein
MPAAGNHEALPLLLRLRKMVSATSAAPDHPFDGASQLIMLGTSQAFLKTRLVDTKEYAIIAFRPLCFCIPQLVAGDLNLRNQAIDFVGGGGSMLKTKNQQSIEIAGFSVSKLGCGDLQPSQTAI